jgi:acetyl esterase/lipase
MPLDRYASRILNMLAAGSGKQAGPYTPHEVRQSMVELAQALDPRDLAPVQVHEHLLDGPGGPLPLRQYLPMQTAPGVAPGLLYLHGGVGVFGSIQTHDAVCRMLCDDAAMTVLSLEYRLAPEHPYPAGLDDAWFAAAWVAHHAPQLGIDSARLAIGGDSAGATLAAVVTQRARDQAGPRLAAQLLLCPVTDLCATTPSRSSLADGYFLASTLLRWAMDQYCPAGIDRHDPRLSPLRAPDFSGLPRALIHTAEFDPFRDEGAAYAQALAAAGVDVRYVCHPGLIHHYYGMAGAIPSARVALRQAAQELRQALGPGSMNRPDETVQ